jgi:hypothetical protein
VSTGDWHLPDWALLSQAGKALLDLLDKAESPTSLLRQLREGMGRLKRLQRLMGATSAQLSEFEESYKWLQVSHNVCRFDSLGVRPSEGGGGEG